MLTAATAKNIERKKVFVDSVKLIDNVPLFSWVELSVTELCNRSAGSPHSCTFCPRRDANLYPNQSLHMSLALAEKIAAELRILRFTGVVLLCGYGEPLLHPKLPELVAKFGTDIRTEIVTNGDMLTPDYIKKLRGAGLAYFVVSMYDDPEQRDWFSKMFDLAGCNTDNYILRDRWYNADQDFGLVLTNRAGTIQVGHQPKRDQRRPCFYPSYQLMIDWNGDVLLCPQDWSKKLKFGNINSQAMWNVWRSTQLHKRRMKLLNERGGVSPCGSCNANGCVHGQEHADAWSAL